MYQRILKGRSLSVRQPKLKQLYLTLPGCCRLLEFDNSSFKTGNFQLENLAVFIGEIFSIRITADRIEELLPELSTSPDMGIRFLEADEGLVDEVCSTGNPISKIFDPGRLGLLRRHGRN